MRTNAHPWQHIQSQWRHAQNDRFWADSWIVNKGVRKVVDVIDQTEPLPPSDFGLLKLIARSHVATVTAFHCWIPHLLLLSLIASWHAPDCIPKHKLFYTIVFIKAYFIYNICAFLCFLYASVGSHLIFRCSMTFAPLNSFLIILDFWTMRTWTGLASIPNNVHHCFCWLCLCICPDDHCHWVRK